MKKQRGIALMLTLWLTTLLVVIASTFALSSRREVVQVGVLRDRAELRAVFEGVLRYAWLRVRLPPEKGGWRGDGGRYEVSLGGRQVRLLLRDEAGKVNINLAQDALLVPLFAGAGASSDEARRLTDAVLDWRDVDDLRHVNGAEAEDYRQAGRSYGPRNQPFSAVEELRSVLGMSDALYQRLAPWVTVHSVQAALDPKSAPTGLLLALARSGVTFAGAAEAGGAAARLGRLRNRSEPGPASRGDNATVGVLAEVRGAEGPLARIFVVLGPRGPQGGVQFMQWIDVVEIDETERTLFEQPAHEQVSLDDAGWP